MPSCAPAMRTRRRAGWSSSTRCSTGPSASSARRPPVEPRTWYHELTYRAETWSRERRVVLVILERPDELFLHHFWLITNWTPEQMDGHALLALYRERGTAEGHMGELMDVLDPALSSAPRPKSHPFQGVFLVRAAAISRAV